MTSMRAACNSSAPRLAPFMLILSPLSPCALQRPAARAIYQASTVFTGSEMPALICSGGGGGPIVAGCCAVAGLSAPTTKKAASAVAMSFFFCIVAFLNCSFFHRSSPRKRGPRTPDSRLRGNERNLSSKLPEQPTKSLDAVLDAAAAQRVPDDRLMRGHAIDAELALQHVKRACRRPMRRREEYGIGIGMLSHQLAAHVDSGMAWDAADLVERRAPAGRAQHLAAEMLVVAGDAVGLGFLVRLAHHDLLAAERFCSRRLGRRAGRDLDLQLGLEIADDLPGIGGAARQIDWHAAEYDDVTAGGSHFARSAHADVVGLIDLVLAAHHDGERGDHERHAFRHDLVEFIRKDFGGKRRRGVADAGAAAVDVAAGLFRHCGTVLVEFGRRRLSAAAGLVHQC